MKERLIERGWNELVPGTLAMGNAAIRGFCGFWQVYMNDVFRDFYDNQSLLNIIEELEKEAKQ